MECQQTTAGMIGKWTIKNFSKLISREVSSDTFIIGGYPWKIHMYPKGNGVDYLSIYLAAANTTDFPKGLTNFKLFLYNQLNSNKSITKETKHQFNAKAISLGFPSFVSLSKLRDTSNGFLVNDTCIIAAEVHVPMSEHDNQIEVIPTSSSLSELVDFRGLGQKEKPYILLLDEVCSQHPSLIECQQNRSPKFTECAFTALGRVLYFLKTKKVKDLNDDARKDLQSLWEELETFRFDLTWLV
ncbi:hypothetical protein RIF29_39551 [Crotalaria pallida]|uniref:MATH domain-containing protein n=1 Tax=Crotalaria pallida TaxID=3830 RepID=A0AAN9HML1_CROPI